MGAADSSEKRWAKSDPALIFVLGESEELIRIFYSSIQTAKRNVLESQEQKTSSGSIRYPPAKPAEHSMFSVEC